MGNLDFEQGPPGDLPAGTRRVRAAELLASLMDNVPDRIYFKDRDSRFLKINRALANWFGLRDPKQAIGKSDADFFSVEHAQRALRDERDVMHSGEPIVGKEEQETWPDGRPSWVSTTKMPLRDRTGAVIGTFGVSRDITARKLAELAVERTQERMRLIVDLAYDAFVGIDSQGMVTDWNHQAELTFGWSREEAIGRELAELIVPPKYREAHRQGLEHFRATGEGQLLNSRIEITALNRQNQEFPVELTITPIQIGASVFFAAFIHDITRRQLAAEELKAAKETAEAANRAKSDFLANMSHEIRTPMNAIIGLSELLLDTRLNDEQREFLSLVKESADSLLTVLNDILDFSKIEAGRMDLETIPFALRDSLGDMLHTLAVRAEQKGLELACRIHPDVPDALHGDPGRLRQILINLIGNAIKFTQRGEVVVDVEVEQVRGHEATLHFRVRDTGIGIPPEKHELVFQAFSQADTSTTRRFGGTGLGLTISAQLVRLMGGRIWLESVPGQGSTFHFTATMVMRGDADDASAGHLPDLKDLRVLVVDDNATNCRILKEILTNWRMDAHTVESAAEAITALEEARAAGRPFTLALLDAMMPGMDGFQLAERIVAQRHLVPAALMMLSSAGQAADASRCRQIGIAAYLLKPIKQSELLDGIVSAMAKQPRAFTRRQLIDGARAAQAQRTSSRPLRILLAEDNAVNQKLAVRLLEKWNHKVRVASSGRQVLAALEEEPFDLVLMDVQMPEMDGFEATAAIRQREQGGSSHLPVIAMTAHAMKGDREECLAAGMDAYISKPIDPGELFTALETWSGKTEGSQDAQAIKAPSELKVKTPAIEGDLHIDHEVVLARCNGDEQLVREIAGIFLESTPELMQQLRAALASGDAKSLGRAAHTIKSSLGYFGCEPVVALARSLEAMGREGDLSPAAERLAELEAGLERLSKEIAALRDAAPPED